MPDYKQSDVAGTKWQRAVRVVVENPLGATPTVLFVEEEVVSILDKTITNPCANIMEGFDAGNPLHLEIYTKLNELYTVLREARDSREEEVVK